MEGFAIKCLRCGHEYKLPIGIINEDGDGIITLDYGYECEINGISCECGNNTED